MSVRIDVTTHGPNTFAIDIAVLDFRGSAVSHIGRGARWTVMDEDKYVLTDRALDMCESATVLAAYHLGACDFEVFVDGNLAARYSETELD